MRYAWLVAISLGLAGCPYMTKSEFDEAWDNDGDGSVSYTHLTLPTNREV